ncbi:MAG: DUF4837 family protein [Bacteroidales bacterium]
MKAKLLLSFLFSLTLLLSSCGGKSINVMPTATGAANEVLVVMSENLLKGEVGSEVKSILTSDVPGLPQSEPNFKVSTVTPNHFDKILKPVRNIFIVETGDIYTQPKFSYARNVWADGQMILYLKAPDAKSLVEFLPANSQVIIDFFVNSEMNRVVKLLKDSYNRDASEQLSRQLGVEMRIPTDLLQVNKKKDFFWASNNQYKGRMDIVVYSVPYTEKDAFSPERILARRDSVMKANLPGGTPGSYMTTQYYVDPAFRAINLNGKYVGEMRGLWEMKGEVMGGPFVSHTRLDEANQRIITVEAFVYAPERKKRNLMRKLEAALYTLQLPQENMLPEVPVLVTK